MNPVQLFNALLHAFGFEPTAGQRKVMQHLAAFLLSDKPHPVYLMKGYAGTGKTSIVAALVKALPLISMKFVLLAPTGRAAKVLTAYSGFAAHTIHRKIYFHSRTPDGRRKMILAQNRHSHCLFIVDEASMIADSATENGRSLLDDLMHYIGAGHNCRLLLIGDNAQLPPVGFDDSPALDLQGLRRAYPITAASLELSEVMRQALDSGILYNATLLRNRLAEENAMLPLLSLGAFTDISRLDADSLEDPLNMAFGSRDFSKAVVICRSNRRANLYNQAIRQRILGKDAEIESGDLIMVVKNNYFWLDEGQGGGFIANGDIAELMRISRFEDLYGFRFADVEMRLIEYPEMPTLTVKIITDTLGSDSAAMSPADEQKLRAAVEEDYAGENKTTRRKLLNENPYYNALQVKYAYALTCHKTQGGQWPQVFLDPGYYRNEPADKNELRWLYTAITRATQNLYLINFKDEFFAEES